MCKGLKRRRQWHLTPVLLPRKSHGWRSLVGCSPWGCKESDTTEQLHFYFSLSCIGEGNGNPLQCSCLENPRDWGAWWAAVYDNLPDTPNLTVIIHLWVIRLQVILFHYIYLYFTNLYKKLKISCYNSVQSFSCVRLFVTP